jgi:hypothetical protein
LYTVFLAIDANFRLKRKNVSSDEADPALGNGWAYFVEEKDYKSYLATRLGDVQEVQHPVQWIRMLTISVNRKVLARGTPPST